MPFHAFCFEQMVGMQSRRGQGRNGVLGPAKPCGDDQVFNVHGGILGLPNDGRS